MTVNSLIDAAIREIAQAYQPGTLAWTKANRPDEWSKMLTLEGEINKTALKGNLDGLRGTLNNYQALIFAMVREFKTPKENTGDLFGQGMFRWKA